MAGTYNASTGFANIYINGEIKNHSIGNGYLSRDWGAEAKIGNTKMNRPLSGLIDEFRLYNYALSPEEIKQLFEKCKFGSGGTYFICSVLFEAFQYCSNYITSI